MEFKLKYDTVENVGNKSYKITKKKIMVRTLVGTVYLIPKHFILRLISLPYDIITTIPNNNTHIK